MAPDLWYHDVVHRIHRGRVMRKVQLSADLLAKLGGMNFAAELCDEAGATKAVVLPVETYREMMTALVDSEFSEENLTRARSELGGYTTAEGISYLNKLIAERGGR